MSALKWRRDGRYHYYEDDKYGWGVVRPAAGGGHLASVHEELAEVRPTVRECKSLVEAAVRKKRRGSKRGAA